MHNPNQAIALADLPIVIETFLSAHRDHDVDRSLAVLGPNTRVTDEGHTYVGLAEIRSWMERTQSEYTYTVEPVRADRADQTHVTVVQRLEGNFPGRAADLSYHFVYVDGVISELVITP